MVVVDRKYAGAAVKTTVSGSMTAGSPGGGGTFTVADATGYPATGKFPVVISRGGSDEEKILIASRSGTTFTVSSRGYDGTTAQSHSSGATCELALDAQSVNLFVDHVDDVEATPHATKLPVGTVAGHDVTTRHQFGVALGTPGTPTTIQPDATGSAGTGSAPAKEDHRHAIVADVAGTIQPDDSAAEGVATSFARSDHRHAIVADVAATLSPGATPGEGVATSFARSDHVHGVFVGNASALTRTSTSGAGSASAFARQDHVHATDQMAWGKIAKQTLTTSGAALGSPASSDFTLTLTVDSTRLYRVHLHSATTYSAQSEWDINFVNTTDLVTLQLDRVDVLTGADRQWSSVTLPWEPTSGSKTVEILVSRASGSGTITFSAGANLPRSFWIEDAGAR